MSQKTLRGTLERLVTFSGGILGQTIKSRIDKVLADDAKEMNTQTQLMLLTINNNSEIHWVVMDAVKSLIPYVIKGKLTREESVERVARWLETFIDDAKPEQGFRGMYSEIYARLFEQAINLVDWEKLARELVAQVEEG